MLLAGRELNRNPRATVMGKYSCPRSSESLLFFHSSLVKTLTRKQNDIIDDWSDGVELPTNQIEWSPWASAWLTRSTEARVKHLRVS